MKLPSAICTILSLNCLVVLWICFTFVAENLQPMANDIQTIQNLIYEIRGQRVMLDRDLAELYGVETRRLNEQVKRNIERFPEDFMFQLTKGEFEILRSQIVTTKFFWKSRC